MLPTNPKTKPCTPVSSNCVVWQGPDISCINLCNGDSISDVVGKLAEELCLLIEQSSNADSSLQGLDLKCLPETDLTILNVTQAIIDYVCNINQAASEGLPNVNLPECLQYQDEFLNPVTSLPLNQYAAYLAAKICINVTEIETVQETLIALDNRLKAVESCVLPCNQNQSETSLVSSCFFQGQDVSVSTLLAAIETSYCSFRDVVGNTENINNTISTQCINSNTPSLSTNNPYGVVEGWIASPQTLSESVLNQWLVLCDLYSAVNDIKTNCCTTGCGNVTFSYVYNSLDTSGNGVIDTLNLNFTSSIIPSGFNDVGGGSLITITDSAGNTKTQVVNISALATTPNGVNIDISNLNTLSSLNVNIAFAVTDGTNTCSETKSVIVPLNIPCPADITALVDETNIDVSFTNGLGTTVSYIITVIDTSNGSVLGTTTKNNPGIDITHTFSGAIPGRTYAVTVTVSQGGTVRVCPSVQVSLPGTSCTVLNTTALGTAGSNDIYLGHLIQGNAREEFYYNQDNDTIYKKDAYIPTCDAPILSAFSIINTANGTIQLNAQYGASGGNSITISYSNDGINFGNGASGTAGVRSIATGITSNSIYLKAVVNCTGGVSLGTILRYDYGTNEFIVIQSPSEKLDTTWVDVAPAGVKVAQRYLNCDGVTYNVFNGTDDSYWFYVGKTQINGSVRYLYAGWTPTAGVTQVTQCCACPAFIFSDIINAFCHEGSNVQITVPYIIGDGNPKMVVGTSTVNGTLTPLTLNSNVFTYSHNAASNSYADTFVVNLEPIVTGDCSSATATIQIQVVPCEVKLVAKNQPIYAFINTNDYSATEGASIKTGLTALKTAWNTEWGYNGEIYFIPTTSNRWLGYQKAIADDGASASLSVDPAWTALENLPTSWSGGAITYKRGAFLIAFSNASSTDYHDATLASGFINQPTTAYKDDYEAFYDAKNGTTVSAWAQGLTLTDSVYPDGFSAVLLPLTVKDSTGADSALILQALAAYTCELIPPSEYGVHTAANVASYLMAGLGVSNPYQGSTTTNGVGIVPLYNQGWMMYLKNFKGSNTITEIENGENADFANKLYLATQSCNKTFPTNVNTYTAYEGVDCDGNPVTLEWTYTPAPTLGAIYQYVDRDSGLTKCITINNEIIALSTDHVTAPNNTPSLLTDCTQCAASSGGGEGQIGG